MLLGKIGGFKIEVANQFAHSLSQKWQSMSRIGNNPALFANGLWDESISFSGEIMLENNTYLNDLKNLIKAKKPVSLVIADVIYAMVVIESIEFTKSIFLANGVHIKEEFSVKLKRYFNV